MHPHRTASNIRYYNNDHLKKLLNINCLLNAGYKISHISNFSKAQFDEVLKKLLESPDEEATKYVVPVSSLIGAALEFDGVLFERIFSNSILKFGFSATIENVLYPVLHKIGVLWQREEINPAQEHFVSYLAKQKLFTAIDSMPAPTNSDNKFLLFLPEFEDHEMGLLYSYYLLCNYGINTIYLGQRVPLPSLVSAIEIIKPTHVLFFIITTISVAQANKYLGEVIKVFSHQKIYLAGNTGFLNKLKIPARVNSIENIDDFKKKLL